MKQRLNHETREHSEEESTVAANHETETTLNFESAEAMLRHDAASTDVPSNLRDRVMRSVSQETLETPTSPWWKRWMPF